VGFFRRREPLHERLAREAGMTTQEPLEPRPPWQETGIHGLQRPREWDATMTVEAPGVEGDAVRFVALPDGSLLVEDGAAGDGAAEEGAEGSLEPLAAAVEQQVRAPYRAEAVRHSERLWAVQARRIEVLELPGAPGGDALDLAHTADGTVFAVDEQRTFGSLPALEERGAREGRDYAVHAERLDGDLWEIRAAAL
jgi:hypothetical protein